MTPDCHLVDEWLEFEAGFGEQVLSAGALTALQAGDQSGLLELAQALREQSRRHPGNTSVDLVEARAAVEETADHEHGPTLAEQFHRE
jgi:hypothetical protein